MKTCMLALPRYTKRIMQERKNVVFFSDDFAQVKEPRHSENKTAK